jgi:hypothetical protein
MASTLGSSMMSLRKFDRTNLNFWKEQMQDYLIVCGQIDPIEHEKALATYTPEEWVAIRMHLVGIRVLHGLSVYDTKRTMEDAFEHI